MRVVAGTARGLKLITRDSEDTKPTLDRVKEAMFSMLMPYLNRAKVLDLFSGSGALGIEALSRGASRCIFCDKSRECCDIITKNLKNTGLASGALLLQGDYTEILKKLKAQGVQFLSDEVKVAPSLLDGVKNIFFVGPDGERFEFFEYYNR